MVTLGEFIDNGSDNLGMVVDWRRGKEEGNIIRELKLLFTYWVRKSKTTKSVSCWFLWADFLIFFSYDFKLKTYQ